MQGLCLSASFIYICIAQDLAIKLFWCTWSQGIYA